MEDLYKILHIVLEFGELDDQFIQGLTIDLCFTINDEEQVNKLLVYNECTN